MKKTIAVLFAVMMMLLSAVPAFAAASPEPSTFKYKVEIIPTEAVTVIISSQQVLTKRANSMYLLSRFLMTVMFLITGKFRAVLSEPTASIQILI